jgi:ApaG protein
MITATTEGIKITVSTQFRPDLSRIDQMQYFFNYRIHIENSNNHMVQLLSRNWYVFDSLNEPNLISGEGVIGEKPLLKPGQKYSYMSGSEINSELGYMRGFYTFQNIETGEHFQVIVPKFFLIYPYRMN